MISAFLFWNALPVRAAQEVKGETLYAQFSTDTFRAPSGTPGILIRIIAMYIGQVRIQGDDIKLPALDGYAQTFYNTAKGVLGPKRISDNTVDGQANPDSHWENTGILCVYRGSDLVQSIRSRTKFTTTEADPAKTIEHRQGSEFLSATNVNYKLSPQTDEKYHYERETLNIKIDEPLGCDKNLDTKTQLISERNSAGDNTFLTNPLTRAAYQALINAADAAGELLNWDTYYVVYKGTTLNPWTAHTDCFYAGCDAGEVSNVNYPVSDDIKDAGGMANTFRPASISFKDKKDGGAQEQGFEYTSGTAQSDTAYSFANNLKTTADGTFCALTPWMARRQVFGPLTGGQETDKDCKFTVIPPTTKTACDSKYFNDLRGGIGYSEVGGSGSPGFDPGYRSASPQLTSCMKERAKWWAHGFAGDGKADENIDQYWDAINSTAAQYNWNPVLVVSIWIEESGAGGHPNAGWDLGCKYGWSEANRQGPVAMPKISDGSNICDQMACLFSHPVKDPSNFGGFMCSYDTASSTCSVPGWGFAERVKMIYEDLVKYTSCG